MISKQDLEQHVKSLRKRVTSARVIGFEASAEVSAPDRIMVGQSPCRVVNARSELAIRRALLDFEGAPMNELLVVVTPLGARDIVEDVLARMAGGRLWRFDPWEAVMTLFGAAELDGRLRRQRALGRALLRSSARINFEPVVAGQLTEQDAWHRLLHIALSMPSPIWSLDSWIVWSMRHAAQARRLLEDGELMQEVSDRVAHELGAPGELLLELLSKNLDVDRPGEKAMVAALGVRAAHAAARRPELQEVALHARTDLTAQLDLKGNTQREVFDTLARAFSRTYSTLAREEPALVAHITDALDAMLTEVEALAIAPFSRASREGWGARQEQLADSLAVGDPDALRESLALLDEHDMARQQPEQMRRLREAAQLSFYLNHWPEPDLDGELDLAARARDYIHSGSHVDRRRAELATADLGPRMHEAIGSLLARCTARRDRQNRAFAASLTRALRHRSVVPEALAMHQVLESVVAPIARDHDVLLVVLDGASWAVMRTLQKDGVRQRMFLPGEQGQASPLLSSLPSVTRLSRTALLTGKLQAGDQQLEKKEFTSHPRLREAIGKSRELALFHKGELDAGGVGGVGAAVRDAILDPQHGVVGVVVNAVDDQLRGAQQLSMRWTLDAISPLKSLLDLAYKRRVVILTSDHGHVWEDRSERPPDLDGVHGRYRQGGSAPIDGEVALSGPMARAFTGEDNPALYLSVDERMRHSSRQRGYHGGASLQEVVTPLVILADATVDLSKSLPTVELASFPPEWSQFEVEAPRVLVPERILAIEESEARIEEEQPPQLDLLGGASATSTASEREEEPHREAERGVSELVEELMNSALYQVQLSHIPALRKTPEDVYRVLVTLLEQGGKAHVSDLARAVQRADSRIRRLIATMRNALNVDGYGILHHDKVDNLVRLDRDLLIKQFDLSGE